MTRNALIVTLLVLCSPAYAQPSVDVGSATGAPGDQVSFGVTINGLTQDIAAMQNDLGFDSNNTPIAATSMGTPDCWVNPAIDKDDTQFAFRPNGCVGAACTAVRAIVISFHNATPIPDGAELYRCSVDISPAAAPGDYPLTISNVLLATPSGDPVLADGSDGVITVSGNGPTSKDDCKNDGWRSFTAPRQFKNQGDCIRYVNTGK
jgi:hypothetical protein